MDFIQSNVLDLGWRGSFQHHLCPIKYDTIALYEFLSWSITVFWVYKAWPLLWKNIGELDLNKFISTLIPCHMIPVDGPYFFISIFQELIFFSIYKVFGCFLCRKLVCIWTLAVLQHILEITLHSLSSFLNKMNLITLIFKQLYL